MTLAADDPEGQGRLRAFVQELQQLGWIDGRNVQIDLCWGEGDAERYRRYAAELVALAPEVILAGGGSSVGPLLQATRSVPIVFTQTPDPVGAGFVESLARPGGNATGFTTAEFGMSAKWLELLKQIAPGVTRAAIIRDPAITAGIGEFGSIQSVAPSVGIEVSPLNVRDASEIERAITAFARSSNGGLIVTSSALAIVHRDLIVALAARNRLPAVYGNRFFVTSGGLLAYGSDSIDPYRRAASYVDRILKGEKPMDLPVQEPTKYGLVINLKTAKALGIEVPPTLLALADEVPNSTMAQRLARNHRLKAKNAPRCKLLMFFPSSPVRPGRTSRLLSCLRSVSGVHPASPALSFAKLRSEKTGDAPGQQFACRLIAAGMPALWRAACASCSPHQPRPGSRPQGLAVLLPDGSKVCKVLHHPPIAGADAEGAGLLRDFWPCLFGQRSGCKSHGLCRRGQELGRSRA